MTTFYTLNQLANETGVCPRTVRRALRLCAARLGYRRECGQWWRLDAERPDDLALIEAVRERLRKSARHGLSRRSRDSQTSNSI